MQAKRQEGERVTTPKAPRTRLRRFGTWLGRAVLMSCFTSLLVGGFAYHRARAQIEESFFGLGEQMMQFADARNQDTPRDLVINGQTIRFSSGTIDQPLDTMLDRFETRCEQVDGELATQLERVLAENPQIERAAPDGSPSLRGRARNDGYVACLDMGDSSVPLSELAQRIQSFGRTGDVSDVGDMRYLYGEEYEWEGATRTHFVAIWTEGNFNVSEMFPEHGDAPGFDVEDIPRPRNARRVLQGYERGIDSSMIVYQARESNERELETHYRQALGENGWSMIETDARAHNPNSGPVLFAEKGERMVTVVLATNERGPGASAAVFSSR